MAKGRPRKAGPRKPCGRLVQNVEPNAKVVELRRAMLGGNVNLADAENPMSLALNRGWITEGQHRAGMTYAIAWRRSHPQRQSGSSVQGAPERHYDPRTISQMGAAEIVEAFDLILAGTQRTASSEASQVQARARYNTMSRIMTPDEQNEVFLCFCLESWPQWILQRCAGRFDTSWERKHRLLVGGLEMITPDVAPRRESVHRCA